jgi:hypothetical protein
MSEPLLLSLNAAAVLLLVAVVAAWSRHPGRRAIGWGGLVVATLVATVYFVRVTSADIPTDWLTVLHYGSQEKSIRHLYGQGVHTGLNFPVLVRFFAGDTRLTLSDVVRMNLGLALVNLVGFFAIATRIQGPWWAIPWTLAFAINPIMFLASFSELPATALHLYFLAGVIAWATLNDTETQPAWIKGAALLLLAVSTILVAHTRLEMVATGAIALGLWTVHALAGEQTWTAWVAGARRMVQAPLAFLSRHPTAVGLLCVIGWAVSLESGCGRYNLRAALTGLYPFNPHILLAFVTLVVIGLPFAVAAAAGAGTGYALFHFRRFGGIALSLIVIAHAYLAAPQGFYETVRYTTNFVGIMVFLGLFGRAAFEDLSRRRAWPESWRQLAIVLYVMAWFTLPLLGTLDPYLRPTYDGSGRFAQLLLDRNTQREVRFLVEQVGSNPQCVFVARALQGLTHRHGEPVWQYILFGRPIDQPIVARESAPDLEAIIAQHAAGAPCVRLYYGDDCNLTSTDRCRDFVAGRRVVDEERFWSQPYNDPRVWGFGAPEIVLATYHWR